jgi:hypothetical protein
MNPHDATEQAYRNGYGAGYKAAKDEIVLCKDCKHTRKTNEREKTYLCEDVLICENCEAFDEGWNPVWKEHFCSCGERKED